MKGDMLGYRFYRRWFGWTRWHSGMTRLGRRRSYMLPRWMDDVERTVTRGWRIIRHRCVYCRVKLPAHKMDCYAGRERYRNRGRK
jgi:hypothetical protein